MEEAKSYYFYLGEVYVNYEQKGNDGVRTYWDKENFAQEVSGMVEFLSEKTPVEVYNAIVELNKFAFIEKLELTDTENKRNPEYRMIINKLERHYV